MSKKKPNLILRFLSHFRNIGGFGDSMNRNAQGELHLREQELKRKERTEKEKRQR